MKPTRDKIFLDSNVIIYSFSAENDKKYIANDLLKNNPAISVQVLNEISNVLYRKLNTKISDIRRAIEFLTRICVVKSITSKTIQSALNIVDQYGFSYYDSLIISSALEYKSTILFSEDMSDGQFIEKKLKIINPFKVKRTSHEIE
jgi:predicted nucleic acid-binding protein